MARELGIYDSSLGNWVRQDQIDRSEREGLSSDDRTESFLATLKKELVHRRTFRTRTEARLAIRHWIEAWYNCCRLHSVLGYTSPIEWKDHYRHSTNTLAA